MGLKYFGTDGIRGRVGGAIFNEAWIRRLGYALGVYGQKIANGKPLTIVVGRDTRESGSWISETLLEGLNEHHGYIFNVGVVPTPAVALSVIDNHATFGIVITASHNPATDNGVKLFSAQGTKLSPEEEAEIEAIFDSLPEMPERHELRRSYPIDGLGAYVTRVRSLMHQQCFRSLKIAVDCSNGATSESTPAVLKHFGAEVVVLNDSPNGMNINEGVGSEHTEALSEVVVRENADMGFAHDGDGDRVIFCDAGGKIVDGDQAIGILAKDLIAQNRLPGNAVVSTVQSNLGLDSAIKAAGGRVSRVDVGDRNVAALMRKSGARLGGENSGHIILGDRSTTGDGLIAAIELIRIYQESNETLEELAGSIKLFPQKTYSLEVAEKPPLETMENLRACIEEVTDTLGDTGRVMIRYSGTEPKLRFLVEAETNDEANTVLQSLIKSAERDLEVLGATISSV
ncbi:MAG: phosphoglucosamine mutase [Opitutales bacterium]